MTEEMTGTHQELQARIEELQNEMRRLLVQLTDSCPTSALTIEVCLHCGAELKRKYGSAVCACGKIYFPNNRGKQRDAVL